METHPILTAALLLALTTAPAFSQGGPLTPPGAPVPTMKSLDEVEPRTPISSLPYTIIAGGSYYFTKNLQFTATSGNAINIANNNVTLDLNGFTLSATAGVTGRAISCVGNLNNIEIKNGIIAGNTAVIVSGAPSTWTVSEAGFSYGVFAGATRERNFLVSHLQVSGCRNSGISATFGSVTNSTATSNGDTGIDAYSGSVSNSTATGNGGTGIDAYSGSVSNSTANRNGTYGISASFGSISNSTTTGNGDNGISADSGSVINSTANSNGGIGISASSGSVINSTANRNGGGISATSGSVTNSTATSNGSYGINATSGSVTNSTAKSNGTYGIYAFFGSVTNSTAIGNGSTGIYAPSGSVTNSTANTNGTDGISADSGSITGCVARANNTSKTDAVDLYAKNAVVAFTKYGTGTTTGSTLTGIKTP